MKLTVPVAILLIFFSPSYAQDNSPYSRYGLGDVISNQHMISRSMGGINAGYADFQSVNFTNPATYGNLSYFSNYRYARTGLRSTIFDIGTEIDVRNLKNTNPVDRFSITNLTVSYLQLGIPIKIKKANRNGFFFGTGFGLKPVTKINYKIYSPRRIPGVDSLGTLYEGIGGMNEASIGFGMRYRQLSVGINAGYRFGIRDYSTKLIFLNDSVKYTSSNSASKTTYNGFVLTGGLQYEFNLRNFSRLRVGAYGNLSQNLKANQKTVRETIITDLNGNVYRSDSVFENSSSGTIVYPSAYTLGFTYQDSAGRWLVGADYSRSNWSEYRYFGQPDKVANNWHVRAGAEYYPARLNTPFKKYFSFVRYRAGVYYGTDYINFGTPRPEYGITLGAGFPLKLRRNFYETQTSYLNTAIEIGKRGSKSETLYENFVRIGIGLSLSDIWFNRFKYY
jgi:hypothetical protein